MVDGDVGRTQGLGGRGVVVVVLCHCSSGIEGFGGDMYVEDG